MTNEKLFPHDGQVSVDKIFKDVLDKKRYKWNPSPQVKKMLKELNKSIVNHKKEENGRLS
jgi:hypothetical protein